MTSHELEERIDSCVYKSKLPLSSYGHIGSTMTREQDIETRKARRDDEYRLRDIFKADLRSYLEGKGMKFNDKRWEKFFEYVWDEGHSSGFSEVLIQADRVSSIFID